MTSKTIIHLDDHTLFIQGVRSLLPELAAPADYRPFHHTDAALQHLKDCFESGTPVHALLTDFNHPGANGYDFACSVRLLEQEYSRQIPILLFTMVGPEHEIVRRGLAEGVFDHYLSKACTKEELLDFLNGC